MTLRAWGMKKMMVLGAAMLVALLFLPSCGEGTDSEVPRLQATAAGDAFAGRQVRWQSSLPDGVKIARELKKPLMVDFYSDRCGWCKVLDRKTYTDAEVRKCAEKFVSVKIDLAKDPVSASQYKVMGLPTILFMNSDGKVIHSVIGFRPPGPFLAEMKKALTKAASAD